MRGKTKQERDVAEPTREQISEYGRQLAALSVRKRKPTKCAPPEPVTVWRMRCHSCRDDYEVNRGGWTCPGCGSLSTELLETIKR